MKVLHINTLDKGGAANACLRIHESLKMVDIDTKVLVLHKNSGNESVYAFKDYLNNNKLKSNFSKLKKLKRLQSFNEFYKENPRLGFFSLADSFYNVQSHPLVEWADLIHLHWISDFVDIPTFFTKVDKPMVWTCHDMSPVTAGCHYFGDCRLYLENCSDCKIVKISLQEIVRKNWESKNISLLRKGKKLVFVANSSWVGNTINKSLLTKSFSSKVIHYPIYDHDFFPLNKLFARKNTNLKSSNIILFIAQHLKAKNKGFEYLLKALQLLKEQNESDFLLVAVGRGNKEDFLGFDNYVHIPYVDSIDKLRCIYNSANLFVIPSVDEAFGQTCLEAMACGLPVIGFNSGGIPDMIEHQRNGMLVEKGNTVELANAVKQLLNNTELAKSMGNESLEIVKQRFSPKRQALKYKKIYSDLLQK